MRKWILNWLLDGETKDWHDMFEIACKCNESAKEVLERYSALLEEYKRLAAQHFAVLNALKDENGIYHLRAKVLEILNRPEDEPKDGGADHAGAGT